MAQFVLAGKADCPYYAKAELLADSLQRSLPNFRVHKISVLPQEWKGWLEVTCRANGWEHEQSPLIWRELVDRGGKGILLGGFSDFLEHCQSYYNMTTDMTSDMMQSIAAENLATKLAIIEEEQRRAALVRPLRVWISSALNPTCRLLIPNLLSSEVFPGVSTISLHLLDLKGDEEEMQWLKMETEDLGLALLHQMTLHTDLKQAFREADVILLLDECWSDGNRINNEETKTLYTEYARLIDLRANREVKVIVSGGSFVNLRCSLLLNNACSVDSHRFVAVATQLENQARAVLAKKLKVITSDVTDVIVWGNIGGSFYLDLQRAKVFNYDSPIKGPPPFSQEVLQILRDGKWLETEFHDLVRSRRTAVASQTCAGAAMSTANGILALLQAWNSSSNQVLSVGVLCSGQKDLPEGAVLSVPVRFTDGKWSVTLDGPLGDDVKETLQVSARELGQVRLTRDSA
ncbi:putative malate dehydrogenase 1B [Aulostomus maculatus]